MSAATLAYSGGAGLLWLSGMILGLDWIGRQPETSPLLGWVPAIAVVWTAGIATYLVATWLLRPEERRLIEELEAVYPTVDGSGPAASSR